MAKRYPMSSYPNGWYAICSVNELQKNKVLPIHSLGRDFVAFQTESGKISVLDAYCPHQGTHLGYGGTIKGETIECPFHKWCFDASGQCQKIPYSSSIPKTKKVHLSPYPVLLRHGLVLIYCSSDRSAPAWEIPPFDEELQGNWTNPVFSQMLIKTHIQELGENAFDIAHFKPVHGSEENSIEIDRNQTAGPTLHFALNLVYPGSGIGLFGKKVGVRVNWRYSGLSVFDNHVTLRDYPLEIRQYFYFTPLDEERLKIQVALRINKDKIKLPNPIRYFVAKLIEKQNRKILLTNFEQDRPIWENKIFREPPILCAGDGPITYFRTWMRQFYSEPQPKSQTVPKGINPILEQTGASCESDTL